MDDYMPIAHTDMQLRDPAFCKTQDDYLMKRRSDLQNYLHQRLNGNQSLIRPIGFIDQSDHYGVRMGGIQMNKFLPSPFLGGALIKPRRKTIHKEIDQEDDEEYFDEDDYEDYEDEGFDINQNRKQLFKSQSQQEQNLLDDQKRAEELALLLQLKLAQERERLLERAVAYRKPVSEIRRTKSCPSKLFIAITNQDFNEDLATYALLREKRKEGRKHVARPWDDILAIVNAEDHVLQQRMKIRKKKQRRPKSAPIIMTKKKISEKDLKRMIDLREKERKKKELEIQKEIERLKEIELREKEKQKEQDKEKQSKQAFVPLVIHPPVLKLNDDALQQVSLDNQLKASISTESALKQGINQTQVQSSTQIEGSDSQRKINQEKKDAQSVFDQLFDKQVKQAQSSEQIGKLDKSKSDFKEFEDQLKELIPSSIDMKSEIQTARSIQQMATMFQGRPRTNSINDQIKENRPKIIYKRNYSHKPPVLTRIPHELLELSHRVLYNLQSRQESSSESNTQVRASQADINTMNESTSKNNLNNVLLKDNKIKISSPNLDNLLPRTWSEEANNVLDSIGIKQQNSNAKLNLLKESNINKQGENKTNLDNINNSSLQPINNNKINNFDNEEEDEEEVSDDEEEDDENEFPSIGSLLPSQGSLDQIIDDTFAIHDQLPSNRGDKIVA
ncbi:MAG: hypothetical protein EZS28_038459, partial [Streblomastix strix]